MDAIDRASGATEQVLDAVKKGEQAALEAVRDFTERVNEALPGDGEGGSRQKVIDSAFQMADRLVEAQYEFVKRIVSVTAQSLSSQEGEPHGTDGQETEE